MPWSGCLCTSAQANCADGADAASWCCMQSLLLLNQMRPSTPPIVQHLPCKSFIKVLSGDAAGVSCCIAVWHGVAGQWPKPCQAAKCGGTRKLYVMFVFHFLLWSSYLLVTTCTTWHEYILPLIFAVSGWNAWAFNECPVTALQGKCFFFLKAIAEAHDFTVRSWALLQCTAVPTAGRFCMLMGSSAVHSVSDTATPPMAQGANPISLHIFA